MRLKGHVALETALRSKPINRFPDRTDARYADGILFPAVTPSFRLERGSRVFTIGSCFARNIEEALVGYELPTRTFSAPKNEFSGRPNGLLNEYNPGSMGQRLIWALEGRDTTSIPGVFHGTEDRTRDMLLAVGEPVSRARAIERRREINAIYTDLQGAHALIVTLGLVECWLDLENQIYLNRMPDGRDLRNDPNRFDFRRLNAKESVDALRPAFDALVQSGLGKIILTVSPVPLQTTFTGRDCVVANTYSKAALIVAADHLTSMFRGKVDYFPSFEIVMSGGVSSFGTDNVHVHDHLVKRITGYMLSKYA